MPADNAWMDAQLRDLYAQAKAAQQRSRLLMREFQESRRRTSESMQRIQANWDEAERLRAQRLAVRTDPDRLRYSAYARLQARLASLPVIEQAKGILMAKNGWPEDEAFEALRWASQRENLKLRDLAAGIVARAARSAPAKGQAGATSTAAQLGKRTALAAQPGKRTALAAQPGKRTARKIPVVPGIVTAQRHNCHASG